MVTEDFFQAMLYALVASSQASGSAANSSLSAFCGVAQCVLFLIWKSSELFRRKGGAQPAGQATSPRPAGLML